MKELNTFREFLKEDQMEKVNVRRAYEEAYKNETGNRIDIQSFDFDEVEKKEVIVIKDLVSNGEELGDVTLVNTGDGYNIGY